MYSKFVLLLLIKLASTQLKSHSPTNFNLPLTTTNSSQPRPFTQPYTPPPPSPVRVRLGATHLTKCNSARHLPLLQADPLPVGHQLPQHRPRHRLVLAEALEITVLKQSKQKIAMINFVGGLRKLNS